MNSIWIIILVSFLGTAETKAVTTIQWNAKTYDSHDKCKEALVADALNSPYFRFSVKKSGQRVVATQDLSQPVEQRILFNHAECLQVQNKSPRGTDN